VPASIIDMDGTDKLLETSNSHSDNSDALLSHCPVCQIVLEGPTDIQEFHIESHFTTSRTEVELTRVSSKLLPINHLCSYCGQLGK
jgi:hypothetical protein